MQRAPLGAASCDPRFRVQRAVAICRAAATALLVCARGKTLQTGEGLPLIGVEPSRSRGLRVQNPLLAYATCG
jgi:hypothetical protein